ncbi:MAG: hypothetical protein R2828_05195 [Saprospiraceae bacterium]
MKALIFQTALFSILGCSSTKVEPEIHLIPQGYKGLVIIDFGIINGTPPEYEGDFRIYKIPENGKLKTQFQSNLGVKPRDKNLFFQINPNGQRIPLTHFSDNDLSPETMVVSNVYVVGNSYHYFIDELQKIDQYKNPAIEESPRQ